jgi:DNA-binding Xre family transcriptional regulator
MRVRFLLQQLLTRQGKSDHGIITEIEQATGIERHKVSRLINGKEDKVSLEHLGALCQFLIQDCRVDPRELPGALFELEPSRFLALLQNANRLHACFGVRQRKEARPFPWLAGADSFLHGKLLELLLQSETQLRADQRGRSEAARRGEGVEPLVMQSQIRRYRQELVHAASLQALENDAERDQELALLRTEAERVDRLMHGADGSGRELVGRDAVKQVALILGSVKSNPVCELATARSFGALPWVEHGLRRKIREGSGHTPKLPRVPQERAVPFYIRYRDPQNSEHSDPLIPSCYAGRQLSSEKVKCGKNAAEAGIYFETDRGEWDWVPCSQKTDCAIVYYDHNRRLDNVEVVMGGFSSLATLLLGSTFSDIVDRLYPPAFQSDDRAVGVFVIQFDLTRLDFEDPQFALQDWSEKPKVIGIDPSVLRRRLDVAAQ